MGHNQHIQHNHQAVDGLVNVFKRANHDLQMVQYKLEKEFQHIYPDNENPMKLVSRIKKIQEELATLKDQCRELLAAKQDLIDKAHATLVGNRILVQRIQTPLRIPITTESEDPAFASFKQQATKIEQSCGFHLEEIAQRTDVYRVAFVYGQLVIDEWTVQVKSRTADDEHDSDSEDINNLLFSAIVQGN